MQIAPVHDALTLTATKAAGGLSLGYDAVARAEQAKARTMDLREAAEQFVSTALINPLLAEAQDDPFKSDLFHGGFAEDAFMQQFNQIIADRMSQRMGLPIVDAIYRDLSGVQGRAVDTHG